MIDIILAVIIIALAAFDYFELRYYRASNTKALSDQAKLYEDTITHYKDIITDLTRERKGEQANHSKLINAVIAKSITDVKDLNLTDQLSHAVTPPVQPSDLVPLSDMSDEDFDKHVLGIMPEPN